VNRLIGSSGGTRDLPALRAAFQNILDLRPGIRSLGYYEIGPDSAVLILSTLPQETPRVLPLSERNEIAAGHPISHFDDSGRERAWVITAPVTYNDHVVGALRGRFSISKFDRLIEKEQRWASYVTIGAVAVTCLVFLALIRIKVHAPIHQLLLAMQRAEAGDLAAQAPVTGPRDIQDLAFQFNNMLGQIREIVAVKAKLLDEIRSFNETLTARVNGATEELRRANMRLVEAQIQAERAQKLAALGELSATVAHELGTPLSAISGHLQMLSGDVNPGDQERRLAVIRSEITRMIGTIRHILDSTQVQFRPAPVDLNAIIREGLALIAPGLQSRSIAVAAELAHPLPPVAGDRLSLQGLLSNLLNNAIQAMANGGELRVKTCQVPDGTIEGKVILPGSPEVTKRAVRLIVCDTGKGIPSEDIGKIFEPFFTTRHAEGGTGLGLAMSRRVVSSCGGRLAVQSAVGCGTMFTIDLPVWTAEGDDGR
jgi:signal transduction histidine kinase